MRLIFISDTLSSGGAERVISILANYFVDKIQTEIVCLRKMDVFYDISSKVIVTFADDHAKRWLGKLKWLRSYVSSEDVLLPFMVKVYCVTLLALLGKKVNVIASERNDPSKTGFLWKLMRAILLPQVRALVVQTHHIRDYFPKRIKKKIEIIMNPVDLTNCSRGNWNQSSKMVLAVGRTDAQKNYPMLIRTFSKLHQCFPEYRLEIWGSRGISEEVKSLQRLIIQLNASDYISIHGRTDDMAGLYEKAYMFVMSSDYEGLSNALIEALCSGLPVVSTKVSGATDIITNGTNGILVNLRDEDQFYEAMKSLIENPETAFRMSQEATRSRSLFEKNSICRQWDLLMGRYIVEYQRFCSGIQ